MAERVLRLLQKESLTNLKISWQKFWSEREKGDLKTQQSFIRANERAKTVGCTFYDINNTILKSTDQKDRQEVVDFLAITFSKQVRSIEEAADFVRSLLALKYEYHLEDPISKLCVRSEIQIFVN